MNTILLLPDGVGIRNLVLGPFLRMASNDNKVQAFHSLPDSLLPTFSEMDDDTVSWHSFLPFRETPVSMTLRYALAYAQMYWADTKSMRYVRSAPIQGSWRTRALRRAARALGRCAASPRAIRLLDRCHCRQVARLSEVEQYRELFQQSKPSVLFCSHQRPPIILPAVLAARSLGIPTATFIFSWDNITSKGRIAAPFDHYLVWSDLMGQELLRFYPDVTPDQVHIVGTPQFDPYADKSILWSREEFFQRIGADPSRPLICYSGGDTGTCPEDHEHVRVLMQLIQDGHIQRKPQVILRPAPVDEGSRYDAVRSDFPELIYARPNWIHTTPGDWSRVIPSSDDVQFLSNLTHYSDLNVNLASTMTLDFAIHDKPVVNIAFDIANPPINNGIPLWNYYYQFEHYRPVVELGAARFARSPKELAEHINAYLGDPTLDREGRRRLVELEVGIPLGQASQRILEVLETISQ